MDPKPCAVCGRPAPFHADDESDGKQGGVWFCLDHTTKIQTSADMAPVATTQILERVKAVAKFIRQNGRKPTSVGELLAEGEVVRQAEVDGMLPDPLQAEVARLEDAARTIEAELATPSSASQAMGQASGLRVK